MGIETKGLLGRAEKLLRQRRFPEAIDAFGLHLDGEPGDVKALLELGICHLLNGSEQAFLRIHDRVAGMLRGVRDLPGDVVRLWRQYRALFAKVTAAALVVGTVALAGCDADARQSAHKYSGGVYQPVKQSIVVEVTAEGQMRLGEKVYNTGTLSAQLLSLSQTGPVFVTIKPADESLYRHVSAALEAARQGRPKSTALAGLAVDVLYATEKPKESAVVVSVSDKGELAVGSKACTAEQLSQTLAERQKATGDEPVAVIVQAAPAAPFKHVAAALGACAAAKLKSVTMMVQSTTVSSHRYSGGVYFRPQRQPEPVKKEAGG